MNPDNKESGENRKRKPPWFLGAFVFGLLILLFVLQSSNAWRYLSVDSSNETLLLYALSSLNFFAFIIFALILARSLLKLRQERRAFQLGAKLKTRLLIYFAAVTLLPLIAMAVFSYLFMNRALERWFTQMPENVIRQAGELQTEAVKDQREKAKNSAVMIAALMDRGTVDNESLKLVREQGKLTAIEVLDINNDTLFSSVSADTVDIQSDLAALMKIVRDGRFEDPALSDGNGLDAAVAPLSGNRKLLIVPAPGPKGTVGGLVSNSLDELDRLKASQVFVRQLGLSTVGLLTFLLIFASSWAAFYVAKGLTRPIKALAEGADEVAKGNYSHRVDVFAEDELKLLVRAFNGMTGELESSSLELEERRRYIETILQSLPTGVISFDENNHITTINNASIGMLRLEEGDFVGFGLEQLVNNENRLVFEKLISRALRVGNSAEQTTLSRENTDGSTSANEELEVAISATALPDRNGTVVVIEDLSELASAQRAAAWQEVARRMAHEIKNPLTPIQLSAERIAKRFSGNESDQDEAAIRSKKVVEEGTETILREVTALKTMVDEFSRYARLPHADKQEIDPREIVSQAVALYTGRSDGVELKVSVDKDLSMIVADGEQLKRVFVNLIDNALESFEPDKSDHIIQVNMIHLPDQDRVRFEVIDDGPGVTVKDSATLFQPYYSTKGRGSGLGLAIVHRIIRDHYGQITVASISPTGTKIAFELPIQSF